MLSRFVPATSTTNPSATHAAILLACSLACGHVVAQPATSAAPELKTEVKVIGDKSAAIPGPYASADALLDALETADSDLRRLSAQVRYDRSFALAGDRQIRVGDLYFTSGEKRQGRRFAVHFDTLVIGDSKRDDVKQYIFDGQWLVEKTPGEKRFVKRQVVPPGQSFDPLRVGEGFMPLPIGQRKADILKRYIAELAPLDDGLSDASLKEFVAGCVQLKLTPRPDLAEEDQFKEVRLWYRPGGKDAGTAAKLLPRLAKAINIAEDESTVQLINVKTNTDASIPDDALDTTTPSTTAGWEVLIHEYREGLKTPEAPAPSEPPSPADGTTSPANPATDAR